MKMHEIKTFKEEWLNYKEKVKEITISDQTEAMRLTFYAGAIVCRKILSRASDIDFENGDDDEMPTLTEAMHELDEFVSEIGSLVIIDKMIKSGRDE